jgi:hypothetical protein
LVGNVEGGGKQILNAGAHSDGTSVMPSPASW